METGEGGQSCGGLGGSTPRWAWPESRPRTVPSAWLLVRPPLTPGRPLSHASDLRAGAEGFLPQARACWAWRGGGPRPQAPLQRLLGPWQGHLAPDSLRDCLDLEPAPRAAADPGPCGPGSTTWPQGQEMTSGAWPGTQSPRLLGAWWPRPAGPAEDVSSHPQHSDKELPASRLLPWGRATLGIPGPHTQAGRSLTAPCSGCHLSPQAAGAMDRIDGGFSCAPPPSAVSHFLPRMVPGLGTFPASPRHHSDPRKQH